MDETSLQCLCTPSDLLRTGLGYGDLTLGRSVSLSVDAQLCCCNKHIPDLMTHRCKHPSQSQGNSQPSQEHAHCQSTQKHSSEWGVDSWGLRLLERKHRKLCPGSENFHPGHRPCLLLLPWLTKAHIHFLTSLPIGHALPPHLLWCYLPLTVISDS